jgi:hypothetical protein
MKFALVIAASIALSACAAIRGYPDQPNSLAITIASLDDATLKSLISTYNATDTPADKKVSIRNQIIYSEISQIDQKFNDFKVELNSQENLDSIGVDFIALALAGLGATTGKAGTKAALAAASAGVIGAKAAIDRDLLYQKTITALITEMEAQRSQVYARILTNMKTTDITKYPLEASSKDIQDYYQAGTLVNAIQGVGQSASEKQQDATAQVTAALSGTYNYTDLSKTIGSFWMPDGKTVDAANNTKITKCMSDNKIVGSVPFLMNAGTDADRATVIKCLGL